MKSVHITGYYLENFEKNLNWKSVQSCSRCSKYIHLKYLIILFSYKKYKINERTKCKNVHKSVDIFLLFKRIVLKLSGKFCFEQNIQNRHVMVRTYNRSLHLKCSSIYLIGVYFVMKVPGPCQKYL